MLTIKSDLDASKSTISDPWQISSSVKKNSVPVDEIWRHLYIETQPLISPAVVPHVLKLTPFKLTSDRILLEDELKTKVNADSICYQQIKQALTLLYWLQHHSK